MTFAELQTAIAGWLHRKDLTAHLPEFITLAESRINAEMSPREMIAVAALTASGGVDSITLPDDLYQLNKVRLMGDPARVLEFETLEYFSNRTDAPAKPRAYTVIGSTLRLLPAPDVNYPVELIYQQRVPPLSVSQPTNPVLERYPDVYLYGALACAQPFLQDDARGQVFEALFQRAMADANGVNRHSGSVLRVRTY